MPCTKPESLRDDQTKSLYFGAQANRRKEEQLETALQVQPDGMMGKHRDWEHNPLERLQALEEEDKGVADGTSHAGQGENHVFKQTSGKTPKYHKSPLAIS